LKPFQYTDVTAEVLIINPNNETVHKYSSLKFSDDGFIDDISFKLSIKPVIGEWNITLKTSNEPETEFLRTFEVREYVLPKFAVRIFAPSYLLKTDNKLEGSFEAKYTFKKSVEGEAKLTWNIDGHEQSRTFQINQNNLKPDFSIPLFSINENSLVTLNLTVTDSQNQETISKTVNIPVLEKPFSVSYNGDLKIAHSNEIKVNFSNYIIF
jgi:uncharacterized protein YfaS (alpha-2-macroglobulin family)